MKRHFIIQIDDVRARSRTLVRRRSDQADDHAFCCCKVGVRRSLARAETCGHRPMGQFDLPQGCIGTALSGEKGDLRFQPMTEFTALLTIGD